jgi:hypothetical protein
LIDLLKLNNEFDAHIGYVASIYSVSLGGNPARAKILINDLYEQTIEAEKTRRTGKINYLLFCVLIAVIAIGTCLIIKYMVADVKYAALVKFILVATFGAIGGYLSIAIKVSTSYYNFDKGWCLQILSAGSRMVISMFSAVAIYTIIQSRLALGVFADINNNYLFYAFAILSGFSETFIPDVFNVLEKKTAEKLNEKKA